MSRKLFRILIVVLLLFVGWGASNRSQACLATSGATSAAAKTVMVEVTFDGLMVFRKVRGHFGEADHYEVGVLDKDTATDHTFRMRVGDREFFTKKKISKGSAGEMRWSLTVMTPSGPKRPDIKARNPGSCHRWQDTMEGEDLNHVFDFCWIMDLEKEFNGDQNLKLIKGKLKPIIALNNGELFTKFKYDQLSRRPRPNGTPTDFGFVAETIGLRVELEPGEKLVLTIPGEDGFELKANGARSAGFYNEPPLMKRYRSGEVSHFPFYYKLFQMGGTSVGDDIEITRRGRRPLNRFYPELRSHSLDDKMRMATFDRQACGATFLGKSNDPLE